MTLLNARSSFHWIFSIIIIYCKSPVSWMGHVANTCYAFHSSRLLCWWTLLHHLYFKSWGDRSRVNWLMIIWLLQKDGWLILGDSEMEWGETFPSFGDKLTKLLQENQSIRIRKIFSLKINNKQLFALFTSRLPVSSLLSWLLMVNYSNEIKCLWIMSQNICIRAWSYRPQLTQFLCTTEQ